MIGAPLQESSMPREKKERVNEPEPDAVRYGAAVAEIEQILASIDRDEIDIDELSQKVERAVELLKVCRAKLRATELRVTEVLKDVTPEDEEAEDADSPNANDDEKSTSRDADEEAADTDDDAKADAGGSKASKPPKRGKKGPVEPPDSDEELPF
jgi:exodeoxyribonuclease VII small subunit